MSNPQRSLVVIRHAKSDQKTALPDIDRPLNARGRRDAQAAGRWLRSLGLDVGAALVSPSERTRQTYALLAQAAGLPIEPEYEPGIYLGDADDLAQAVRELPVDVAGAVLVGHWPGCPEFVEWLIAGQGEEFALRRMRKKYPTAGAAWLSISGEWADAGPGSGELLHFEVCRG